MRPGRLMSIAPALLFPALLLATLARAEENPSVNALFAEIASDLTQSDASAFIAHFDRKMSGYDRLYEFVRTLSDQDAVSSAIDVLKDTGDDRAASRGTRLDSGYLGGQGNGLSGRAPSGEGALQIGAAEETLGGDRLRADQLFHPAEVGG